MSAKKLRDKQNARILRAQLEVQDKKRTAEQRAAASVATPAPSSEPPLAPTKTRPRLSSDVSVTDSSDETLSCDGNDRGDVPAAQIGNDNDDWEDKDRDGKFAVSKARPVLRLSTDRRLKRSPSSAARRA
eukprot:2068466-Pyramimonas_sp.AAC.1